MSGHFEDNPPIVSPQPPQSPVTLPLPPVRPQLLNHYPSIWKKRISIKKDDEGTDCYVHFIFVSSDSKNDIHEEISKCFNMERFSLRDSEQNFITGSYDSLERDKCYDIIDRSEKSSKNSEKSVIKNEVNLVYSDDTSESIISSELGKGIENEEIKKQNSKNDKIRKRKGSVQFITRAISIIPLQAKKRKIFSPQNSSIEHEDNITAEKSNSKKKSKSTPVPRACSRCRQIKKGCDRKRPCGRCIKSNLSDNCDAGKTDYEEQQ
ncbi:unnamed protein product [Rhizophagus irregularis]|uniref:Zn(2)-C6 fungal-type domain-containing protein n=1 Tax=Rhizophagus irregularis TaxID=588596 RepID=A0A915ZZR2_9GLOM|nr:unnamed protein product [Rhizophagus irregularis]GBC17219.1 RING-4 like protein [Rhizophagus irregularis DAOM 181602=DAOM 197198]CAB4488948.1 unnamed protein product [Rhizophagus irregularis]CAB5205890.1 unnamed protein product [Rhizophagus irregularis]CAB5393613.1 unnamed protein product [Rhizophagus irregularis]